MKKTKVAIKFKIINKFDDNIVPLETLQCPGISLDSTETILSMKPQKY